MEAKIALTMPSGEQAGIEKLRVFAQRVGFVAIPMGLLISGCTINTPQKLYDGPVLPRGQISTIYVVLTNIKMQMTGLDNRIFDKPELIIQTKPGQHSVNFATSYMESRETGSVALGGVRYESMHTCRGVISIQTEPGHIYYLELKTSMPGLIGLAATDHTTRTAAGQSSCLIQ